MDYLAEFVEMMILLFSVTVSTVHLTSGRRWIMYVSFQNLLPPNSSLCNIALCWDGATLGGAMVVCTMSACNESSCEI